MSGRDWLAGLVGGANALGASLNHRRDLREQATLRQQERDAEQQAALELIKARAAADPKAAPAPRNPVTVWAGDKLLQWDDQSKAWLPAVTGGPTATMAAPNYTGHENDAIEHGADAAMGALVGAAPPIPQRVPVTKPPTPKPDEPLVPVVENGKTIYVKRSDALGKEAPRAVNEPNLVTGLGPDGKPVRVVDRPGVVMPSEATTDKPATDAERLAAGFADRMAAAHTILSQIEADPQNRKLLTAVMGSPTGSGKLPGVGNFTLNQAMQQYKQAQMNWVRANLRKESGAAIGKEEMAEEIANYFPVPGDSDALIEQKARNRELAEANMRRNAGRAGAKYSPDNPFAKPPV